MGWEEGTPLQAPAQPQAAPLEPWQTGLPYVEASNVARPAETAWESVQAGWQGSVPGLAWRGKLPDIFLDPQHSKWWQRALGGITQVGAELPLMAAGSAVGAPAGAALGSAITGPAAPAGAAVGGLLGAGAGMFAVPGAIRETLMQAYKSGDISTAADFWNILREVATTTAKEAAVGAATFGAGSVAARAAGSALVPTIGSAVSVPTAIKAIGGADVAAQIATMTAMPAALQGRLPDAQEIMDAAIVIGGLKTAHWMANRVADVYAKTGKTPAEQVQDAQTDPSIQEDILAAQRQQTGTWSGIPLKLDRLIAEAEFLGKGGTPYAPDIKAIIREIKAAGPQARQGDLLKDAERIDELVSKAEGKAETVIAPTGEARIETVAPAPLTDVERAELDALRTKVNAAVHDIGVSRETSLSKIYSDVYAKMLAADRPAEEATAIATIERERYRARAERIGMDPGELYFAKPLEIRGEPKAGEAAAPEPKPPIQPGPEWTKLDRESSIPGIRPPDTYTRPDDVGTRTMELRDGRVVRDRSMGVYEAQDPEGYPRRFTVVQDHVTGRIEATEGLGHEVDLAPMLEGGLTIPEALKRAYLGADDALPTRKVNREKPLKPTDLRGIDHPDVAEIVRAMAYDESGWITKGGKLDLAKYVENGGTLDKYGRPEKLGIVAMTKWIPKAEWWMDRPDKSMNPVDYRAAIDKALKGEPLSKPEQRAIDFLVELANERLRAEEALGPEFEAIARDALAENELPTTENVVDADAVARVAAFDEGIVERLAIEHANDDVAFMKAIREILNDIQAAEEEAARARASTDANRAPGAGAAPSEDGNDPLKYEQRKPEDRSWYYSELTRAIESSPMKQGTAKAWQDYIKSRIGKGVKPEEIEATGINDWLATQEGKVTKEQVAAFMEQGGVKVTETVAGGIRPSVDVRENTDGTWSVFDMDTGENVGVRSDTREGALEEAEAMDRTVADTKFHDYQLPGSVPGSYRELVLTLPTQLVSFEEFWRARPAIDETIARREYARYAADPSVSGIESEIGWQSSHFPDAGNYLAHTRVNDRILPDGRKVLFVEEIQSDRAQKGRQEGFNDEIQPLTDAERTELREVLDRAGMDLMTLTPEQRARRAELIARSNRQFPIHSIPRAPFVTKTDSWTALVLKRLLRYAAEGDYAAIAWTRGEQQVERYTSALRKAVDVIEWKKTPEGVQIVGYKGPGRLTDFEINRLNELNARAEERPLRGPERDEINRLVGKRNKVVDTTEKESALSDAIGKSMADRIRNDPNQTGTIEGENITVSDTGMAGYYDRIVPGVMRDVLRRIAPLAGAPVGEAITSKKVGDSGLVDAKFFANLGLIPSFVEKGFDGLNSKQKRIVQSHMLAVGQDPEILKAIVGSVPVDVVNVLRTKQLTPEMFFHDPAMLVDNSAAKLVPDMAGGVDVATALVRSVAGWVAEHPTARLDVAGLFGDKGAALGTIEGKHGVTPESSVVTGAAGAETSAAPQTVRPTVEKINIPDAGEVMAVPITPAMREKIMGGLPLFQEGQRQEPAAGTAELRGAYTPSTNLIELFKAADKSTALHEIAHSWLEELKADAARPDASEQLKTDWETVRRELAIPASGEIGVASHEQWARSTERYVSDGKAPSVELQGIFARFREWLMTLWRHIREQPVQVSDDLRSVLDRMLATDDQIQAAKDLGVPRAYVPVAAAEQARKIVPGEVAKQAAQKAFADELPTGPGEAPDTSRINYKYINSSTDLKLAMQRLAELDQAAIQEQRSGTAGVKSWEQANAEQAQYLNDILGGAEDTLHLFAPRDPSAPHVDVRLGILKKLAVGAAKDSARLRDVVLEKGFDATVMEQLEYMGSIERARMIQAEFLGERASVARALNALKDVTEGSGEIGRMLEAIGVGAERLFQRTPAEEQAYLKAKLDEILLNYKGKTVLDIARLHKEIGTLKGTFKLAKEVGEASTWEKLVEGWKSGLLSGPVTHVTNLFGTGAFQALRPVVDTLAAGIGIARGADVGERLSAREGLARITGYLGGIQDGAKVGYHTFMLDETTGKTESYRNAIPGRAGDIIRIPLRAMAAEDAMVSTMYTRGELRTLAIREAFARGHDPRTREFAETVDRLVDNPTPEMQAEADRQATRFTFNAELGEKGRTLQLFVNKWNLQWMMPFIRTPLNIAKELGRMTPLAPVVGEWRAAIAKGGIERDRAIAEVALGSTLMSLTAAWAFAGNVSGSGSPDQGKNRAKVGVWQPYSVLIGDTWYEYDRIQPTGTLMGLAADMAAIWDHMTEEEMDKVPKMLATAFANAVTNQTFLQGLTNMVNAMSDPTRFAPRFGQQFASSLVPNIVGQPTAMADPYVREVNNMLEAIQARIPGARGQLLPKRDWLGEPVETKERFGVVSPIRQTTISEDKVRQEADRLDISVAAAPKKTHIGKGTGKIGEVELTPEERDKFAESGGKMAHSILTNIVNAPGWDQMPDLVKRRVFTNVLTASHRFAAAMALPVDKKLAYIQQITERMQQELQPSQ